MPMRIIGVLTACLLTVPAAGAARQEAAASFDSNGVRIHYLDRGRGAPVVLIHGFTGSYARHWEAPGVVGALQAAGYRVIAMDCRGHGQSDKPRDPGRYGLEMVQDAVRLLDHLQIERAHIVGYSMGGAIANQLLVRYPGRLLTVTLLGAGWAGEDVSGINAQMLALADAFARRDASPLIRGVTAGPNAPTDAEVVAMNKAFFARNDADVMASAARGLLPLFEVSRESLRATTLPVLALIGEHDANNLEGVKRMMGVVARLEVVNLPGVTHATSVKPSAAPLIAFLDKHRRP